MRIERALELSIGLREDFLDLVLERWEAISVANQLDHVDAVVLKLLEFCSGFFEEHHEGLHLWGYRCFKLLLLQVVPEVFARQQRVFLHLRLTVIAQRLACLLRRYAQAELTFVVLADINTFVLLVK